MRRFGACIVLSVLAGTGCSPEQARVAGDLSQPDAGAAGNLDATTGGSQFGVVCEQGSDCAGGVCGGNVGGVARCTTKCVTSNDCQEGWSCTVDARGEFARSVCTCAKPDGQCGPSVTPNPGSKDASSTDAGDGGAPLGDARTAPQATVLRSVLLTAADSEIHSKVKVVLIVDNSPSMAEEQARIATGLQTMMTRLRSLPALDLQFFVYSTSSLARSPSIGTGSSFEKRSYSVWADGSVHPERPLTRISYRLVDE